MPVNPRNPRKLLVVHGVQTGTDADQHQDQLIHDLIAGRLGDLKLEYDVELYRYENINDRATAPYQRLLELIAGTPAGAVLAGEALDLLGDVVISVADGGPAHEIRRGLRARILSEYAAGNPIYLVAHSLGSIYAFDVVNELMHTPSCYLRLDRTTWPVQGLVTLGSPIGLSMFRKTRPAVSALTGSGGFFRWRNYWDRTDPVVSGSFYGRPLVNYVRAESYVMYGNDTGWIIRDRIVDTGKQWLFAHTGYWNLPVVGDELVEMIAS
ncbi:MAG: hypothetical protein KGK44_01725 [Gammaproteobacteria bacterium]|nr:hypothetical protein [Gammaproteobacteria bacterium]